jgi:hypothetical protein
MRKILLLAALLLPAGAMAQGYSRALPRPPDDSNVKLDAPGLMPKKGSQGAPEVRAQPQAWPRLDPGAVICRSEADLARLAARRRGEPVAGPVDCQPVRAATAITVTQRKGPGQTEIRTTDPAAGGTGWTDAWLPEKAPASAR